MKLKSFANDTEKDASFGDHRAGDIAYRWTLSRTWDSKRPAVAFCMLNPSTADHMQNDPTVERCERRARSMNFGKLIVVNIFALRSTDPDKLYVHPNPTGGLLNDQAIIKVAEQCEMMVCGWGQHGKFMQRGKVVLFTLRELGHGAKLRHLGINSDGTPKHPLYIGYKVEPQRF